MLKEIGKKDSVLFLGKQYAQKKGMGPLILRILLQFFSFFWQFAAEVRNWCYDHQIFSTRKTSSFVVSIGNLVAGGTGKTPLTLLLAERLIERGGSLAILSRGYGSSIEREKRHRIISQEEDWQEVGDEPLLFKRRLKEKIDVIVGKDRWISAQMAEKRGRKILLLDDGMQARFFHRDVEITLLNGRDLFGQDAFLPLGLLREGPKELKRSHYIIVNHIQDGEHFEKAQERIRAFTNSPVMGMRPSLSSIKDLQGEEVLPQKTVAIFCAIAQPQTFYDLVHKSGCSIVHTLFLPDHGSLSHEDLLSFAQKAKEKGALAIVCTEKDRVKLKAASLPLPIYYVEMSLEIVDGKEIFEELVQRIVSSR